MTVCSHFGSLRKSNMIHFSLRSATIGILLLAATTYGQECKSLF